VLLLGRYDHLPGSGKLCFVFSLPAKDGNTTPCSLVVFLACFPFLRKEMAYEITKCLCDPAFQV
jgi:hypothetical protein